MSSTETPVQDPGSGDFERNLRRVLQAREPGAAPDSLRAAVPVVVTERVGVARHIWIGLAGARDQHRRSRLATGLAFALSIVLIVTVGVLGLAMTRASGIASGPSAAPGITWHDGAVTLTAASVTIDVGGQLFEPPAARVSVHSDPGSATYRTLEIEWLAGQQQMRLFLYFKADGVNWWASEIRTYDGQPTPDWVYYRGPLLKTPIGQTYRGDLDIQSSDGKVPGHLVIKGMRLDAFQPGDGPRTLQDCHNVGAASSPNGSEPDPMASGQPLANAGLGSMSPLEIGQLLQAKRYCYTFRLEWQYADSPTATADLITGYSQIWCVPPAGKVSDFAYGSSGELIVFVEDPTLRTVDPNTPTRVGC